MFTIRIWDRLNNYSDFSYNIYIKSYMSIIGKTSNSNKEIKIRVSNKGEIKARKE